MSDTPDADDLTWARDDMGLDATDDEVYEVAARRARERVEEDLPPLTDQENADMDRHEEWRDEDREWRT